MYGDVEKSKNIAHRLTTKLSPEKVDSIISKKTDIILPKDVVLTQSDNFFIKNSKINEITDNINPKHILDLRKEEFKTNLPKDIENIFRGLSKEIIPLEFKSMEIKHEDGSIGELEKTTKDIYKITLVDDNKKKHRIEIDLPHMNDDGTFRINGQDKVLVTQLVSYPLFFWKPFMGGFQSTYTTISIISKQTVKGPNLIIYIQGIKLPLIMVLAYKLGFKGAMDLFEIQNYTITTKKVNQDSIKLGSDKFITFNNLNESQNALIGSLSKSIKYFPNSFTEEDFYTSKFWENVITKYIGNRNCIYLLDTAWKNSVTPIEIEILKSKGDPVTLEGIIKYISSQVVTGRSDDRNDLSRLRIRLSELFSALIQKQAKAAYSEYLAKRSGGDDDAEYYVDSKKVFSEFQQSQNLQPFESINPLEELSMLTRITPIGIGGINAEAMPVRARNIHASYFGI